MDKKAFIRINKFLSNYNKSFDDLTRNQKEKFIIIDEAIQIRLKKIANAKMLIKENAITPVTISKDTGILRPTFYQQPLFDAYIKSFMDLESKESSDYNAVKDQRITDLENEISTIIERDFDWANKLAETESIIYKLDKSAKEAIEKIKKVKHFANSPYAESIIEEAISLLESKENF